MRSDALFNIELLVEREDVPAISGEGLGGGESNAARFSCGLRERGRSGGSQRGWLVGICFNHFRLCDQGDVYRRAASRGNN